MITKYGPLYYIKFQYRDRLSNWNWRIQECSMSSLEECIKFYGLGVDCDYKILEVRKIED